MSKNIRIGKNTYNNIDTIRVRDADNPNNLLDFNFGGSKPNIHFSSTTPPTDTSKLWVKTDINPLNVSIKVDTDVVSSGELNFIEVSGDRQPISSGTSIVFVDNKFYYIYSITESYHQTLKLCYFDPINLTTSLITTIYDGSTKSSNYAAMFLVGRELWINSLTSSSSRIPLYKYNLDTGVLTSDDSIYMMASRNSNSYYLYNSLTVLSNDKLFLIGGSYYSGGYNGSYYHNGQIYSVRDINDVHTEIYRNNGTWTGGSIQSPQARVFCAYKIGDYIYALYYQGYNSYQCYLVKINTSDYSSNVSLLEDIPSSGPGYWSTYGDYTSFAIGSYIYFRVQERNDDNISNQKYYRFNTTNNEIEKDFNLSASGNGPHIWYINKLFNQDENNNFYYQIMKMQLPESFMLITNGGGPKNFNIINSETLKVNCYPSKVYLGNSNNEAELVEAALYDNDTNTWVNI